MRSCCGNGNIGEVGNGILVLVVTDLLNVGRFSQVFVVVWFWFYSSSIVNTHKMSSQGYVCSAGTHTHVLRCGWSRARLTTTVNT